jgi:hypothetical protein
VQLFSFCWLCSFHRFGPVLETGQSGHEKTRPIGMPIEFWSSEERSSINRQFCWRWKLFEGINIYNTQPLFQVDTFMFFVKYSNLLRVLSLSGHFQERLFIEIKTTTNRQCNTTFGFLIFNVLCLCIMKLDMFEMLFKV